MNYKKRVQQVEAELSRRGARLVGYAPRGTDLLGLKALADHVAAVYSLYDRFPERPHVPHHNTYVALEDLSLRRRLSREFDVYDDQLFAEMQIRNIIINTFRSIIVDGKEPLVLAYEAHGPLMTLIQKVLQAKFLGNDLEMYRRTSKKPPIEEGLLNRGVESIHWRDIDSTHQIDDLFQGDKGYKAIVVRRDGGSSGKGIIRIDKDNFTDELRAEVRRMLRSHNASVSVSEYHEGSISMSISGVIFPSKKPGGQAKIAHFPVSTQIVGRPSLTNFPFGFCGNDYKFVESLPDSVLDRHDAMLEIIGQYLADQGYIGSFGVDTLYLPDSDRLLFTEVNARFQATTRLLSQLTYSADQSDTILEHLAATLGLPFGGTLTAREWRDSITPASQLCVSNIGSLPVLTAGDMRREFSTSRSPFIGENNIPRDQQISREMWPAEPGVLLEPDSVLNRIVVPGQVLRTDGINISPEAERQIALVHGQYRTVRQDREPIGISRPIPFEAD